MSISLLLGRIVSSELNMLHLAFVYLAVDKLRKKAHLLREVVALSLFDLQECLLVKHILINLEAKTTSSFTRKKHITVADKISHSILSTLSHVYSQ